MVTITINMRKGTIIILHYCRVNSAAAFIIPAAILNFFRLQQRAIKEKPANVQQI
jgi:hypothetical protein